MDIVVNPETNNNYCNLSVDDTVVGVFKPCYGVGYFFHFVAPIHNMYGQNRIDEIQQVADKTIACMNVLARLKGR